MISKEMYLLLKMAPRHNGQVSYATIEKELGEKAYSLVCDAVYPDYDYLSNVSSSVKNGAFFLTEKGQAAVEEYEQAKNNQATAKGTLIVSIVAIVLSVISIAVALLSSCGGVQ